MNFRYFFPPFVRVEAILVPPLVEPDGFGGFGKKIDDGAASQAEGVPVDGQPAGGHFIQQEKQIEEFFRFFFIQVMNVQKKKFLRKCEVFLKQAVAGMGIGGVGEYILFRPETDRSDGIGGQINRPAAGFRKNRRPDDVVEQ